MCYRWHIAGNKGYESCPLDKPIQLEGKITVVTGAAGGIGKAIVQRLRAQGATVIPTDVQAPADADALFYQLDVTDTAAIQDWRSTC